MAPDVALMHLRRKIGAQLTGGSHGLMRSWVLFRTRSGSSKDGITFHDFQHGLRNYGLPVSSECAEQLFDRLKNKEDNHIHISEFIDNLMGRWKADANTHFGGRSEDDIAGSSVTYRRRMQNKALRVDAADKDLTVDEAIVQLRRNITQRLPSGPNGLMRCWIEFRQRAGSTKEGIRESEFERGLQAYGIKLTSARAKELFARMDVNTDDHIQIKEFVDCVIGRWTPEANTHFGGRTAADISGEERRKAVRAWALELEAPDATLTIDDALRQLRRNITQRLPSGPNGLMRCWIEFRQRAGSTKEGIRESEFERGLQAYGIKLTSARAKELFARMDVNADDHIQIKEFVDVVMGRWSATANTVFGGESEDLPGDRKTRRRAQALELDAADKDLTVDEAIVQLRRNITQRLPSGPNGLMRCWIEFRQRAGSTKEGIRESEFERGLQAYGIKLTSARAKELFARMDVNADDHIQIKEFVDVVMGRWSSSANSGGVEQEAEVEDHHGGRRPSSPMMMTKTATTMGRTAKWAPSKSGANIFGGSEGPATVLDVTAGQLAQLLRIKLAQKLQGDNLNDRAWRAVTFAGGGSPRLSLRGLDMALRAFGLRAMPTAVAKLHARLAPDVEGLTDQQNFVRVVMNSADRFVKQRQAASSNQGLLAAAMPHHTQSAPELVAPSGDDDNDDDDATVEKKPPARRLPGKKKKMMMMRARAPTTAAKKKALCQEKGLPPANNLVFAPEDGDGAVSPLMKRSTSSVHFADDRERLRTVGGAGIAAAVGNARRIGRERLGTRSLPSENAEDPFAWKAPPQQTPEDLEATRDYHDAVRWKRFMKNSASINTNVLFADIDLKRTRAAAQTR